MAEKHPSEPTLLDKMSSEMAPETSPLLRLLADNAKRIVFAAALCVVVAAGYGVYAWHSGKKLNEAQDALASILILPDSEDKVAKLKTFSAAAPAGMQKGTALALARTAMHVKDYAAAHDAWDSLAKDPGDSLYVTAMVGKAESLAMRGMSAEALVVLTGMTISEDSDANTLVNSLIAELAEKTGDTEKAIAACEKLVSAMSARSPEEAEYWRQKAASLRLSKKTQ